MSKLRVIVATFAACVCASGLSVGAALAEEHQAPPAKAAGGKPAPKGVCILHDLGLR